MNNSWGDNIPSWPKPFTLHPERFTPDFLLTLFSNPTILRIASIINYCPCILSLISMTTEYSGRSHLKSLFRLFGFHYLVHQSGALAIIPHDIIRCLLLCRRFPPAFSCLITPPARLWVSVPAQCFFQLVLLLHEEVERKRVANMDNTSHPSVKRLNMSGQNWTNITLTW